MYLYLFVPVRMDLSASTLLSMKILADRIDGSDMRIYRVADDFYGALDPMLVCHCGFRHGSRPDVKRFGVRAIDDLLGDLLFGSDGALEDSPRC